MSCVQVMSKRLKHLHMLIFLWQNFRIVATKKLENLEDIFSKSTNSKKDA
jgi:hypothetical protein